MFDWIGAQLEQEGYRAGLRAHEKVFGSGIETPKPLAIPHTGADLTRTPVLAIVVTRHPIPIKLIASSRTTPTNLFLFPLLEQESAEKGLAFYSVISRLRNKNLRRRYAPAKAVRRFCALPRKTYKSETQVMPAFRFSLSRKLVADQAASGFPVHAGQKSGKERRKKRRINGGMS